MNNLQTSDNKNLIPLILGITGHRDIRVEDKDLLKNIIKDFIKKKQQQYPHTPVVMLSPLAEGADRIAASAAIEADIRFIAILPMPAEEYKKSFTYSGSADEFDILLSRASKIIEIPPAEGLQPGNIYSNPDARHEQYYQVGIFNARYSHYLIALWDGTDNKKKGGTADVVKIKQTGIPGNLSSESSRLQVLQTGPILHIRTPRISNSLPEDPMKVEVRYPDNYGNDESEKRKHDDLLIRSIDEYNEDCLKYGSRLNEMIHEKAGKLIGTSPEFSKSANVKDVAIRQSNTALLAKFYQTRRFHALKVLLSLVLASFFFLQIYGEFYHKTWMLLLYPVTMSIGAGWFIIARRRKYEHKHEDYRAMAEALRVQFYLKAGGYKDNVSDHYLKRHRGELEWVLYTLRSYELDGWSEMNSLPEISKEDEAKVLKAIKESFIDKQLGYFMNTAEVQQKKLEKWESLSNGFFIGAIVSAFLLFIAKLTEGNLTEAFLHFEEPLQAILSCCMDISLVLAAVFQMYCDKMVFSEQTKNYQQMAQLFTLASNKFSESIGADDQPEARKIIREALLESLLENGEWLMLHRSRPMELPKG